jgi:hypothetical protein
LPLDAASQFQLQNHGQYGRGRGGALADKLVYFDRGGAQFLLDGLTNVVGLVLQSERVGR